MSSPDPRDDETETFTAIAQTGATRQQIKALYALYQKAIKSGRAGDEIYKALFVQGWWDWTCNLTDEQAEALITEGKACEASGSFFGFARLAKDMGFAPNNTNPFI